MLTDKLKHLPHCITPFSHCITPPSLHHTTAPSGPVRGLKLVNSTANSLSLSWSEPEQRYINHPEGITGYFVELRNVERNRCGTSVVSSHPISEGRTTFNYLPSYTQYCVRVYPRNAVGQAEGRMVARGDIIVVTKPISELKSSKQNGTF